MVTIKSAKEIETLREGGWRLALILKEVAAAVRPGISAFDLNQLAFERIKAGGDEPSFLNYAVKGEAPFPSSLCVSVNDEVVHGVASKSKILREGDIVGLDLGLSHKKLFVDHAVSVGVGKIDKQSRKLLEVTRKALAVGIAEAAPGKTTGDIGYAVEQFVKRSGFSVVRGLAGHGVGYAVHEDPFIPNYGKPGSGEVLKPGMVIAIEPMVNDGKAAIVLGDDGFAYKTADGRRSAHFEHTVVITENGVEILTSL